MLCSKLKLFFTLLTVTIIFNAHQHEAYRILGIFPFNSYSHMAMFESLMKGLARRGHQVDVVSTFPLKTPYPNYTSITIRQPLPQYINNMTYEFANSIEDIKFLRFIGEEAGYKLCVDGLVHPEIQKLIQNPPQNPPYDLVIIEVFGAHCFMAFAHHLKVPLIGASSGALHSWVNEMIGNPENLAFVPNNLMEYTKTMGFWWRVKNVLKTIEHKWYFQKYTATQDVLIRKYFGPDAPGIRELERSLALLLSNSHVVLNGVKPIAPALIEVGGLHIQDDGPDIPAEHKQWLDESTEGFVYFSFGSMVKIETFPRNILDILYESLEKIAPVRVLMKVPQPEMLPAGLPSNVRTFSWMPQLKVLKHKNIRAFLTHGGLMSTQEAIAAAVPLIGIPLFADQFVNIDLYVQKKIAIRLDHSTLTQEKLDNALNEILHNPVYRNTMRHISKRFMDEPLSPMDKACFWVEYIIRHGSKSLRTPSLDLTWWQVGLLDVYAFLLILSVFAIVATIVTVRFVVKIFFAVTPRVVVTKKFN